MIRQFFIAVFLLVTATFPAWAETHEVIIDDTGFHPEEIEILSGDTVKWINRGTTVHSATGMAGVFDSGPLSPGLSHEHTFNNFATIPFDILEVSYGDMKDEFLGKIILDGGRLEISPRDSKFLDEQKITMTIFYPNMFYFTSIGQGGTVKVFYDETLIFEGTMPELAEALPVENMGSVAPPYDDPESGRSTSTRYLSFSLPPGIHKIAIEAEYKGKKFQDSVTYTIFHGGPMTVLF